tara:strand:- start:1411 stop:2400 length:990 start_codon:yes stop_codon:yes gene_type:complete
MNNKTILLTGGTGSFGYQFIKHIYSKYKPLKVIVYSRDEFKQYQMSKKFIKKKYKGLRFFIGDIRDRERLNSALKNVDYVVHAAALKHVPIAEYNPQECIKTNIMGAQNLIDCSIKNNVKKVIALSTDKASNPGNLYGATKLVSDKLFISSNILSAHTDTIFSVVRYGNVLNSRGSVIPYFKSLLKQKKELTVTDKSMTRFFISIEEAVKFCVDSFNTMKGGEIFIPKIPSMKIFDIAKVLSNSSKIKIIGLRPGEKLHESLCSSDDSYYTYEDKKSYVIIPSIHLPSRNVSEKKMKRYKKVKIGFEYNSDKNNDFLNEKKVRKLLNKI